MTLQPHLRATQGMVLLLPVQIDQELKIHLIRDTNTETEQTEIEQKEKNLFKEFSLSLSKLDSPFIHYYHFPWKTPLSQTDVYL